MATRTVLTDVTFERKTRVLTLTITDPAGTAFKPNTLTLHLYCDEDGSIINSRSGVSILDVAGGVVTSQGVLTLTLSADDNVIVLPRTGKTQEKHVALLQWTRTSDGLSGGHEIEFSIAEIAKVP
jgi:hypothetical protein